jgi:UPF0042 nucleotide-binding protein
MTQTPSHTPLLILTGLSGAGMSSALKHLEDMGYEAFDNFPLSLADQLVNDPAATGHPVAIGIDTRSRAFSPDHLIEAATRLNARLIYLTADDTALHKRFTETRRRHPMAKDRPVSAGIQREKEWLYALKDAADTVIDTSDLSVHDLRHRLEALCGLDGGRPLTVTLLSFAFRHGLPRDADMVFDARFLRNPHWDPVLKPMTGLDQPVRDYVIEDEAFAPFLTHLQSLILPLLPRFAAEGKSYLTLAFGCTGGRHRSVTLVEIFKSWLENQGLNVTVQHRDLGR